ncbi:MAG: hypothetical protein ACE5JP_14675, partial [Candidatus Bipolaricaulia bacterium]
QNQFGRWIKLYLWIDSKYKTDPIEVVGSDQVTQAGFTIQIGQPDQSADVFKEKKEKGVYQKVGTVYVDKAEYCPTSTSCFSCP